MKENHFTSPSFPPLHHTFICFRGLRNCSESCSRPFRQSSLTCKSLLQWFVGMTQNLWLMIHHSYYSLHLNFSQISFFCPKSWRSCWYGSIEQRWLHELQQVTGRVYVGVGQFKALNVGLGNNWVSLFRTPLGLSPSSEGPDQIFQAHDIRTISLICIVRGGITTPFVAANNRVSFPKALEIWRLALLCPCS